MIPGDIIPIVYGGYYHCFARVESVTPGGFCGEIIVHNGTGGPLDGVPVRVTVNKDTTAEFDPGGPSA